MSMHEGMARLLRQFLRLHELLADVRRMACYWPKVSQMHADGHLHNICHQDELHMRKM